MFPDSWKTLYSLHLSLICRPWRVALWMALSVPVRRALWETREQRILMSAVSDADWGRTHTDLDQQWIDMRKIELRRHLNVDIEFDKRCNRCCKLLALQYLNPFMSINLCPHFLTSLDDTVLFQCLLPN